MAPNDHERRKAAKQQRRVARKAQAQGGEAAHAERTDWAKSTVRVLLADGLTTSGLDHMRAGLPAGSRTVLARGLLAAVLALDHDEVDLADTWKFAPSLTYMFGPDAVRQALAALEPTKPDPIWLLLASALEPPDDPGATPKPADAELAEAIAPAAAALALGEVMGEIMGNDAPACLALLLGIPRDERATLATLVLGQLAPAARQEFAVFGLLAPTLGQAVRAVLASDLARNRKPAQLSFLASLGEAALGPGLLVFVRRLLMRSGWAPQAASNTPLAADPRAWPVTQVLASARDATGSQGTYLLRQRGKGRFAFISVIENTGRGAVDAAVAFDLDADECHELVRDLGTRGVKVVGLTPALAAERMEAAIARCRALGHPLPYDLAWGEGLLDGAATAGAAASPRRTAPPAAALAQTWVLLHTTETAGLRVAAPDSAAAAAFLEMATGLLRTLEAGKRSRGGKLVFPPEIGPELRFYHQLKIAPATQVALTRLAAGHGPAAFDDARRRAWQAALVTAGRAFAAEDRPQLAGLAAEAAAALDPNSGVAIADQPFVLAAMAISVFDHMRTLLSTPPARSAAASPAEPAAPAAAAPASPGFMAFADGVFAALPMGWPPADYRAALLAVGAVWNAGVDGRTMGPALEAARAALGGLLARAEARERKAAQAALEALPARWALEFAGARLRVLDVRTRRDGLAVKIDLVLEEVRG